MNDIKKNPEDPKIAEEAKAKLSAVLAKVPSDL